MCRLTHTIQIAYALNIRIADDAGRPVSAYIMPVALLVLSIPAWLYTLSQKAGHYLAGWQEDVRLIGRAGWLLAKERRFHAV